METIYELPNDEAAHLPPIYLDAFGRPQYTPYVPGHTGLYCHPLTPATYDITAQPSYATLPSSSFPYTSLPTDQPVSHELGSWSGHPVQEKHKISRPPLTEEERRNMCFFHETAKHMGAKQSDITAFFNVERSTVSKVLKNKEKYLNEAGLGAKANAPTFEAPAIKSALLIWIRVQQREGYILGDQEIIFKAGQFALICRCPEMTKEIATDGWLEDFKRKYITNMDPHKTPTSPKSQFRSASPANTNYVMDKSDIQRLGEETHAAVENGAAFSPSPNEIDDGNHTTGVSPLVGEELEVKQALELVNIYFECQGPGLSLKESESLNKLRNVLEERVLFSGRNSQG